MKVDEKCYFDTEANTIHSHKFPSIFPQKLFIHFREKKTLSLGKADP